MKLLLLIILSLGCAQQDESLTKPFVPETVDQAGYEDAQKVLQHFLLIQEELANDRMVDIKKHADALAQEWETLTRVEQGLMNVGAHGLQYTKDLGKAKDLIGARAAYQELSRSVVALMTLYPNLQVGKHIFSCPMVEGYTKWVQEEETMSNPYMGTVMLQCGTRASFSVEPPANFGEKSGHYTCSMHPSVNQESPGLCPLCNMELSYIDDREAQSGVVRVDGLRRQKLGIRIVELSENTQQKKETLYAETTVNPDEVFVLSLRFSGWISKLHTSQKGTCVEKGDPLIQVYSPEVYAAQKEYLVQKSSVAKQKLLLLGLSSSWIDSLRKVKEKVTIYAPRAGCVQLVQAKEGEHVPTGFSIMEFAPRIPLLEMRVFPEQAASLHLGARVQVGSKGSATVQLIDPFATENGRTKRIQARFEEAPKDSLIGARIPVSWEREQKGIFVPVDAVIFTGERRIVFIDEGEDRLRPTEIEIGERFGEWYLVKSGLKAGDRIAATGVFLLASESRLRSSSYFWSRGDE